MTLTQVDIVVAGAGVAGLITAASFGQLGYTLLCCDPTPPATGTHETDLRTTAFLQPARDLLETANLWPRFAPRASALQIMRIVDAGGPDGEARQIKDFCADDIGATAFGWNVPNWVLRRELLTSLGTQPNVDLRFGVGVKSLLTRASEARVNLSDGSRISAQLVIGADGRNSPVRDAVGIEAATTKFGQHAITCALTHQHPHDNISTEIHRSGGPFTLVPLPDHDGQPCSALVWMDRSEQVNELLDLSEPEFEAAMLERSAGLYGPLKLVSRRSAWPIIAQLADRFTAERTALIAEAAHVAPPIGAQGLNTSLGDLAALLKLGETHDLGSPAMLAAYEKARYRDVKLRVEGIKALNRTSMAQGQTVKDLRAFALNALHEIKPLRQGLMKLGLGATGG